MTEKILTLCFEEIESLLSGKKISIYELDDGKSTISIRIPNTKRESLRMDILARYDNEEYWDKDILEMSDNNFEDINEFEEEK